MAAMFQGHGDVANSGLAVLRQDQPRSLLHENDETSDPLAGNFPKWHSRACDWRLQIVSW